MVQKLPVDFQVISLNQKQIKLSLELLKNCNQNIDFYCPLNVLFLYT